MKKLLAVTLAMAMLLSMAATAPEMENATVPIISRMNIISSIAFPPLPGKKPCIHRKV